MSDDQASLVSDEGPRPHDDAQHEGQWYIIDPTGIRLFWIIVTARRVLFYSLDNIGGAPIFFIDIATITALVPKDNTLISIESLGRKYWIQRYGVKLNAAEERDEFIQLIQNAQMALAGQGTNGTAAHPERQDEGYTGSGLLI